MSGKAMTVQKKGDREEYRKGGQHRQGQSLGAWRASLLQNSSPLGLESSLSWRREGGQSPTHSRMFNLSLGFTQQMLLAPPKLVTTLKFPDIAKCPSTGQCVWGGVGVGVGVGAYKIAPIGYGKNKSWHIYTTYSSILA